MSFDRFVLDSGVAIAWFSEESEAARIYAASVLRLIRDEGAIPFVPPTFHVEVAEFLMRRRRTKAARFGQAKLESVLEMFDCLGIRTVVLQESYREVIEAAAAFHVQAKDAPFIKLARALDVPLAAIDNGQRTAARIFKLGLVEFH